MSDFRTSRVDGLAITYSGSTPSRSCSHFYGGRIPWVKSSEVNSASIRTTEETLTEIGLKSSSAKLVDAGNPLVAMYGATAGKVGWLEINAATNQAVLAVTRKQNSTVNSKWLYWALLHSSQALLSGLQGSGQPNLSKAVIDAHIIQVPPESEQPLIAEILDTVDTSIHATEAIIDKLTIVKRGLLHDLLTRGVDSNGELRPPQSEAPQYYKESPLGWIPKEWEVELLDSVAVRGSGHTPNKNIASYWNAGIKWVSLADSHNLDKIFIHETDKEISELGIANSSAVIHPSGTVILSRDAGIGKSAILVGDMAVSQHFMAWRCGDKMNNFFLYFYLQREKPKFETIAIGSTIKTIGLPFFKSYNVVVPPRYEQDQIAAILMTTEQNLSDHSSELGKLRKQKVGLMEDLLTGRVRVTPRLEGTAP